MTMHFSPSKVGICIIITVLAAFQVGQGQSQPAACKRSPVLFVFGDSNSDTGGSSSAQGNTDSYPNGRIFPTPSGGRVSDGKLIVDFLCENLTATYPSAYLNSVEPDFKTGVNFAVSGSTTTNTSFSLPVQINQMRRFYNLSLQLQAKGHLGLHDQVDFQNALYVFDIGQNDIALAVNRYPLSRVVEFTIPESINKIQEAIMAIYKLGGRFFWIHNTGPLGCLPWALTFHKLNSSDIDEHGCILSMNVAAKSFNAQLDTRTQELRTKLEDATIVYVDMYSIKYDFYAFSDVYGFVNPQKACCETCLGIGNFVCEERFKYISWDGIHYTEAANSLVASKILSQHFSKPPLPLNFFCNS